MTAKPPTTLLAQRRAAVAKLHPLPNGRDIFFAESIKQLDQLRREYGLESVVLEKDRTFLVYARE